MSPLFSLVFPKIQLTKIDENSKWKQLTENEEKLKIKSFPQVQLTRVDDPNWKIRYGNKNDSDVENIDPKINRTPFYKILIKQKGRKCYEKSNINEEAVFSNRRRLSTISLNNRTELHCLFCFKGFITERSLERHINSHVEIKLNLYCAHCPLTFTKKKDLIHHLFRKHELKSKLCCHTCSRLFKNNISLQNHEKRCDAKRHPCQFCRRKFQSVVVLQRHELIYHKGLPHACKKCGERFQSNLGLIIHKYKYCNADVKSNKQYQIATKSNVINEESSSKSTTNNWPRLSITLERVDINRNL